MTGRVLVLVAGLSGLACDRGDEAATPASPSAPSTDATEPTPAPEPTAAVAAPLDPELDEAAGALAIDRLADGIHWVGEDTAREVLYAFAVGAWRAQPTPQGMRLHVAGAPVLAARLGLREGDVVDRIGALELRDATQAHRAMQTLASGELVKVRLVREGTPRSVAFRIGPRRSSARARAEVLVAATTHEGPALEKDLLTALGRAHDRFGEAGGRWLLEQLGLDEDAAEIALDGQSIAPSDLARLLGDRADAEMFVLGDGKSERTFRVVPGPPRADDLAEVLDDLSFLDTRPRPGFLPSPETESGAEAPTVVGIREVAPDEYEIDRSTLDAWLGNPAALAKAARIIPSMRDGKTVGFKLYGIRRSSPLSALGFHNGDLVEQVAGRRLDSLEDAMEVYTDLRKAKSVEIRLERRGRSMKRTFTVREGH